jgi:hypothetical protein
MPYYKVRLSGTGVEYQFQDSPDPVIGFFTTRLVSAPTPGEAELRAKELVLRDWQPGGECAAANRGGLPALTVERVWPIGLFKGIFSRRPAGYTFYCHD